MIHWLLTADGIKTHDQQPLDTPFGRTLVHHGQVSTTGIVAVIVNHTQIWNYEQEHGWHQLVDVTDQNIQLNCLQWVNDKLLVGTSAARLAWVDDGELDFIVAFDKLEGREQWNTPWGGPPDVRSLARTADGILAADIHVGWIVTSVDGESWIARKKGLHKDVHHVTAHPSKDGIISCATAGGWYVSRNGGESFDKYWDKSPTYQRTTAWFGDTDIILSSVSSGPSGYGAKLYRSEDWGKSWEEVEGLPELEDNINTYQITIDRDGRSYIIANNNSIYQSRDYGKTWKQIAEGLPKTYQIL